MSEEKLRRKGKSIIAGDFTFEQKGNLLQRSIDWWFHKDQYEEVALGWMEKHYAFYGQLCDEEYVTRGSILSCSCGSDRIRIELPVDHGVIAPNGQPLMTCADCEAGTNIGSFGVCYCDPSKFGGLFPHPTELSDMEREDGRGKYICFPVLKRAWISREGQDFAVKVADLEGDFEEALNTGAVLICQYGGLITIDEVPDASDAVGEILEEEREEFEEEVDSDISEAEEYEGLMSNFNYDWMKEGLPSSNYVTLEFLKRVVEIADELEIDPDDLMAVMAFESWITPDAGRPNTAYGLVQFTEISIQEINRNNGTEYTKADVIEMDIMEQLELAYLLYRPFTGRMHGLGDVYLGVFAPVALSWDERNDDTILYSEGRNYEQNRGLDRDNKGYITIADAYAAVIERRDGYYRFEE